MFKKFNILFIFIFLSIKTYTKIPVVFINSGDNEYLLDILLQAKQCNEQVILIGDICDKHYALNGIEFVQVSEYSKSNNYFKTIYKHMTSESYEAEFARFSRWFILHEFMKSHDIPIAFYAESDVMLYCNINEEYTKNFNACDAVLNIQNGFCNGSISYWNEKAIGSFCSFLKKFYEDSKLLDIAKDLFRLSEQQYQDDWPHMTNWAHDNNGNFKIENLSNLLNNTIFDSSINDDYSFMPNAADISEYKYFRMKMVAIPENIGIKKQKIFIKDVIWNKGLPYCYINELGNFVRLKSLKFTDVAQFLIKDYRSKPELDFMPYELYNRITELPFYMLGFFGESNRKCLEIFIKDYKPKIVVELGTWLGASASFMALLMPEESKLYAVDYFDEDLNSYAKNGEVVNASKTQNMSPLYHQFLSNILHYNLWHKIIPIKMNTVEASLTLDIKPDLIYVDVSTDEEAIYQNIMHWHPKLNENGIICGDNWKWFTTVQKGVTRAAQALGKKIIMHDNFWYFDFEKLN